MTAKDRLLQARRVLEGKYDPIAEPEAAGEALETLQFLLDGALKGLDAPPASLAAPPPAGPPTAVDGSVASAPAAPLPGPAATVSGSGGPQNAYEWRMTPHQRAVGMCPDCSGQLRHAPTCPKFAPPGPVKLP